MCLQVLEVVLHALGFLEVVRRLMICMLETV